ncbi:MAG: hypothetical protein ACI4EF_00710 [Coprococcus sp.]
MDIILSDDPKREMIVQSAYEFHKLNEDDKLFILGYMLGIQQERQKKHTEQNQHR